MTFRNFRFAHAAAGRHALAALLVLAGAPHALRMRGFVAEARNVTIDEAAKTATLSKIFDWFAGDFAAYEKAHGNPNGTQIDYVNRYRGALPKIPKGYAMKFFEYDKGVNRQ